MPCVAVEMSVEARFRRAAPAAHGERSSRINKRVFQVFIHIRKTRVIRGRIISFCAEKSADGEQNRFLFEWLNERFREEKHRKEGFVHAT